MGIIHLHNGIVTRGDNLLYYSQEYKVWHSNPVNFRYLLNL
jgi:hypothetical protein